MACKSCAERRERMKAWIAKRLQVEAIRQAAKSGTPHGERDLESDTEVAARDGATVPDVPEGGQDHGSDRG